MSCNSASVGFCPSDLMTVPNSLVVMVPSPSLSNSEKASLNSAICSSVSWSACKLQIRLLNRISKKRLKWGLVFAVPHFNWQKQSGSYQKNKDEGRSSKSCIHLVFLVKFGTKTCPIFKYGRRERLFDIEDESRSMLLLLPAFSIEAVLLRRLLKLAAFM